MSTPNGVRRTTVYFDVETGGVEPHNPTIQLAAVAVDDLTWKELNHFEVKIQFDEAQANPEALKLNHYDRAVWEKEAKPPKAIAGLFSRWAQPYMCLEMTSKRNGAKYWVGKLAGHNSATFDLPRLQALFYGTFFPFSYLVKDTLQRAMWFYDEHPDFPRPASMKLSVLCEQFCGVEATAGTHDALTDVRMSVMVARSIMRMEQDHKGAQ